MRMSRSLIVACVLLFPLQAMAQGGSAGGSGGTTGSGSGSAGVTSGAATGASKETMPGPPGTNSLGTAQSSGGVTTGSAGGSKAEDEKIQDENRKTDQKLKGICKGC
jgi:hypothetical protein